MAIKLSELTKDTNTDPDELWDLEVAWVKDESLIEYHDEMSEKNLDQLELPNGAGKLRWRVHLNDVTEEMRNRWLFPEQKETKELFERWSKYMEKLVGRLEEVEDQIYKVRFILEKAEKEIQWSFFTAPIGKAQTEVQKASGQLMDVTRDIHSEFFTHYNPKLSDLIKRPDDE